MGTSRILRRTVPCVPALLLLAAGAAGAGRHARPAGALEPSTTYAVFVMSKITDAVGFGNAPAIYRAPVDAAHAIVVNGREAIVYNQDFLDEINDRAGTPWAAVSVIAHELGHHYYGHSHKTIEGIPPAIVREHELDADYFSGFVLARMGASLDDAEAAQLALFEDVGSPTHPDSYHRLAAISAGWSDGVHAAAPAADPAARIAGAERDDGPAVRGFAPEPSQGPTFPSGLW